MEKKMVSPSGSYTSVASGTILGKRKFRPTDLPEFSWPEESLLKDIIDRHHRHNDTTETRLIGNSDSIRYEIEYSNNMPRSNELQPLKHEEQFQKLEVQTGETPKLPSWILEKGNISGKSESKGSSSIPSHTSYIEKSQRKPVVQNTALTKTPVATFCTDDLSVTRRAMGTFRQSSSQPDCSNILSDRRASMDEVNEFDTSCSFGQKGQVFQKIESNNPPKACADQKDIQTRGHSNVGDSEGFSKEKNKSSLVEEFASRYGHNPDKSFILEKQKLNHGSHRLEEKSRSKLDKTSLAAEKIWDGSLRLNSSIAVPTVAFFKSGEKWLDVNWPGFVDVKGKVRLEAFEKYIQELSRSRNRGLMVVSICSNEGSETDIKHMKEVANGYIKGERVGLARLAPCVDLYLCPRTDAIITILAKHGFFKGLAATESKCELFIGCVVWRKNQSASASVAKKCEQVQRSLPLSIDVHTASAWVPMKSESKIHHFQTEQIQKSVARSVDVQTVGKCASDVHTVGRLVAKSSSVSENSDIKDNKNTGDDDDDDDLPEFDFGSAPTGKKEISFDDDDMPEWVPPNLKKESFSIAGFKNLPFHHHPQRSAVSSVLHPPFNIKVPPPVPSRDGYMTGFTFNPVVPPPSPSYMTGFTFNPVIQPPSPSYMTGFTFNPVVQPPSGSLAVKSPLQPAGGVWKP